MIKKILIMLLLVGGLFVFSNKTYAAGMMPAYNEATIKWAAEPGAMWYNLYFKEVGAKWFTHAVPNLSSKTYWHTIGYLRPGVSYVYKIAAKNDKGVEYWWSKEMKVTGVKRMMVK